MPQRVTYLNPTSALHQPYTNPKYSANEAESALGGFGSSSLCEMGPRRAGELCQDLSRLREDSQQPPALYSPGWCSRLPGRDPERVGIWDETQVLLLCLWLLSGLFCGGPERSNDA